MSDNEASPDLALPPRSVGRNVAALMASQISTFFLAALVTAIQPRFLGPVGQGKLRVAISLTAMVEMIAVFGTSTLLQVEVARRPSQAFSLSRHVMRVRVWGGLFASVSLAVFLWLAEYDRGTIVIVSLVAVATMISLGSSNYRAGLYGLREMGKSGAIDVITKLVVTAAAITVLLLGWRVLALALVTIAGAILTLVMSRHAFNRILSGAEEDSSLQGRSLLRAAVPYFLSDAALITYLQIDTVVMSLLVGQQEIGWYATADLLFGSLLFIPVVLTTALFPAIAELHQRDPSAAQDLLQRTFRSLMVVAVPIGVATILVSKPFIHTLYGARFDNAVPVLRLYGIVTILTFMTILLGRFCIATGRAKTWNAFMFCAIIATVPLDIVLVPWTSHRFHNGALGGVLSYIATEGFLLIAGTVCLARSLLTRTTALRTLRCAIGAGAMFAVGWPLRDRSFALPAIVSLATYGAVMIALKTFDPDEWRHIRSIADALRRIFGARFRSERRR